MTTATEGMELTRVGPGTVMGDLMRHYWMPAAMSSELARDGAPIRLMLLGEKLIAFRDSEGRVGVMDHRCPHRCASLFLGRNEEGGIRCIYHGWKFDVAGNCLDMPSLPPPGFKQKVKAKAYKVVERAGVVWVYMGDARRGAAAAGLRDPRRAGGRDQGQLHPARLQLAAGARGRDRHLAFRLPARRPRRSRRAAGGRAGPATRSSTARRSITWPRCPGARSMPATARRGPAQTYWRVRQLPVSVLDAGAQRRVRQPHACARLGAARRPAHDVRASSGGSARFRPCRCRSRPSRTARRSAAPARGNKMLPNTTDWLGRWRMAENREQRLGHGPRGPAEQRDLQRHRRHPPAGPGHHREHGRRSSTTPSSTWRRPTR